MSSFISIFINNMIKQNNYKNNTMSLSLYKKYTPEENIIWKCPKIFTLYYNNTIIIPKKKLISTEKYNRIKPIYKI